MTQEKIIRESSVKSEFIGQRIDQVAAILFPEYSRSQLQQWIKSGELTLNGRPCKAKQHVIGGEFLSLSAELVAQGDWEAENISIEVVYEDSDIVVVNKPAGLVVHPGAGNPDGTLLNALLYHYPDQKNIPRAGIVHRLDKDTSGLMVVAQTLRAQASLVQQLQKHTVSREYEAVVVGAPIGGGSVDEAIGRHPRARTRMAVVKQGGKSSVTHFRILHRYPNHAHLRVQLETGRTHQIRVHLDHIGFPLVGDPLYGGRLRLPPGASPALITTLQHFRRQALHAASLSFEHPLSGKTMHWATPLPEDFSELLLALERG